MTKDLDVDNVIQFDPSKVSIERDENDSKDKKNSDESKVKKIEIALVLADVLAHRPLHKPWQKIDQTFHVIKDSSGNSQIVEELPGKILKYVSPKRVKDCLMKYYKDKCLHLASFPLSIGDFASFVEFWDGVSPEFPHTIHPVLQLSEPGYTWHRLPFDFVPGDCPTWMELINRMTNASALVAWIGSLFDPQADRQQYVWLQGDGGDGKGSMVRALEKAIGPSFGSEVVPKLENQFWTSGLLGKRLVVFPDTNKYGFPATGLFKSLTGGDMIRIERKRADSFTAHINCKFMFLSQFKPLLSNNTADLRRIIYCEVGRPSVDFGPRYEELLWEEIPEFLSLCLNQYRKVTQPRRPIPVDSSQAQDLLSISNTEYETVWERHFETVRDQDQPTNRRAFVSPTRIFEILKLHKLDKDFKNGRFYDWMQKIHGCEVGKVVKIGERTERRCLGLREKVFTYT